MSPPENPAPMLPSCERPVAISIVRSCGRLITAGAVPAVVLIASLTGHPGRVTAYDSLSQVESAAETREYTQQVREKKFGDDQRAFLTEILLPQLANDANRSAITRTRLRIRELAVRDAAKEVFDPVNAAVRDAMLRQVAEAAADPLVRVNAMLMIGELVGSDGKPWPAAAPPLAAAVADTSLPPEVRIAALAGLARHVAAAAAGSEEIAALAGPAVVGLLTTPPEVDPVARRWMIGRALDLLPAVAPPPAAVAAAARLLATDAADVDVRVRAALAVGRLARPEAGIDAAAAVNQIRDLAIAAVAADLAAAEQRRVERRLAGGGSPTVEPSAGGLPPASQTGQPAGGGIFGGQFGGNLESPAGPPAAVDEDAVPPLACRRDAWRLYALAEAIRPSRSAPGLADLLGGDEAAAVDLAAVLRQAAIDLDAKPDEATLADALADLRQTGRPAGGRAGGKPAPAADAGDPASPFDQPAGRQPADPF